MCKFEADYVHKASKVTTYVQSCISTNACVVKHRTKEGWVDLVGNPRSCLQTMGRYNEFCVQTLVIAPILLFWPL